MPERSLAVRFTVRDGDKAQAEFRKLGKESTEQTQAIDKGAREASKGVNQLARANRRAGESTTEQSEAARAAERASTAYARAQEDAARKTRVMDQAIDQLGQQFKEGQIDADRFRSSVRSLEGVYGETTQSARLLGREQSRLDAQLSRAANGIRAVATRTAAAGAAAGAAATGGIALLGARSLETAANLGDLASRANTNVEALQRITFAAEKFGVQQEAVVDGLRELNSRADEFATTGSGPAAEAFERLGINADQARELVENTGRGFNTVIERVRELDSAAARTRVLEEIFGDQAGEQLAQIGDGFLDLQKKAENLGLVIDASLVRQADEARDKFNTLTSVLGTKFTATVARAAPQIDNLLSGLLEDLPEAIAGFENLLQRIGAIENVSTRAELEDLENDIAKVEERLKGFKQLRADVPDAIEGALSSLGLSDLDKGVAKTEEQLQRLEIRASGLVAQMLENQTVSQDLGETLGGDGGSGGGPSVADGANDATAEIQGLAERAAEGKPPIDKLTESSIDLSQSLEIAALKANAFRDQGAIEAGSGRIAREAADSARDAGEAFDDASDNVRDFGREAQEQATVMESAMSEAIEGIQRSLVEAFG